eukprot:TRINITY_DN8552_c0_g1_i1.p1 TRINITY_DN8552_c0_g1~~TRINITY_DN8552_c0_g1_i1.p1  ORF type:complete len:445 (+),score=96.48 TRINITY_DN8552_c0_g1_i1:102-1436(+)
MSSQNSFAALMNLNSQQQRKKPLSEQQKAKKAERNRLKRQRARAKKRNNSQQNIDNSSKNRGNPPQNVVGGNRGARPNNRSNQSGGQTNPIGASRPDQSRGYHNRGGKRQTGGNTNNRSVNGNSPNRSVGNSNRSVGVNVSNRSNTNNGPVVANTKNRPVSANIRSTGNKIPGNVNNRQGNANNKPSGSNVNNRPVSGNTNSRPSGGKDGSESVNNVSPGRDQSGFINPNKSKKPEPTGIRKEPSRVPRNNQMSGENAQIAKPESQKTKQEKSSQNVRSETIGTKDNAKEINNPAQSNFAPLHACLSDEVIHSLSSQTEGFSSALSQLITRINTMEQNYRKLHYEYYQLHHHTQQLTRENQSQRELIARLYQSSPMGHPMSANPIGTPIIRGMPEQDINPPPGGFRVQPGNEHNFNIETPSFLIGDDDPRISGLLNTPLGTHQD